MAKTLPFPGFEPLTANYIYCPNQFFDVCLPHYSRGVVRLVAYLLRQTLRFRDANGDPIQQNISISYRDFTKAGISRGSVRKTVDEASAGGFIACAQRGMAKAKGNGAQTARYTLRWGADSNYVTDPMAFAGFYTGEGCRSPIPDSFFDHVVPHETLAVVKVVGAVLRHTVGYENQFGRRDQAPLSYSFIQKYTKLGNRTILAEAIRHAIDTGYIQCVTKGWFNSHSGRRRPSAYAIKWLGENATKPIGSERIPATTDRFRKDTSIGSKSVPSHRFKTDTHIKTDGKDITKQQQEGRGVTHGMAAAAISKSIQILCEEGFDAKAAQDLAAIATQHEIQKQITWIDMRKPANRLGMLRTAIEHKWEEPIGVKERDAKSRSDKRHQESNAVQAAIETAMLDDAQKDHDRRRSLLADWHDRTDEERTQYHNDAIAEAPSSFDRTLLRRHTNLDDPPMATLDVMARALGIAKPS